MISEADSQTNLLTNIQGGIMIDHNFEERQFVKIRYRDAEDIPRERYLSIEEIGDLQTWSKRMIKGYKKQAADVGKDFDESKFKVKSLIEISHIDPGRIKKLDESIQDVKRLLDVDDPLALICGREMISEIELWEDEFANIEGDGYLTMLIDTLKRGRNQLRKNLEHQKAHACWMMDQKNITGEFPQ